MIQISGVIPYQFGILFLPCDDKHEVSLNHWFFIILFLSSQWPHKIYFSIHYCCYTRAAHFRAYEIFRERCENTLYSPLKGKISRIARRRCENRFYPYSRCVLVRRISSLMHSWTPWFPRYFTLKSNGRESRRNVYTCGEKSLGGAASSQANSVSAKMRDRKIAEHDAGGKRKPQNWTAKQAGPIFRNGIFRFRP